MNLHQPGQVIHPPHRSEYLAHCYVALRQLPRQEQLGYYHNMEVRHLGSIAYREGFLLLVVVLSTGCGRPVEQLVAEGGHAMKAKEWARASDLFEQALHRDPTLAEVYRALADCRIALGDREGAAEALRGLLRLRPDDCRAHLLLAQYAAEQERWDDAVSHIVRARKFAEYRDDILATQRLLNNIRAVVTSATAEAPATILEPTGETP